MADNPWRCPQEWGTPRKGANETLQLTQTAWNAIDKLNAVKEEKGISLMKLIIDKSQYNHNFPVLPPFPKTLQSLHEEGSFCAPGHHLQPCWGLCKQDVCSSSG
jgi:hypothetical protein